MSSKIMGYTKINSLIERFFITAVISILITTLSIGLYFNKCDEKEKRYNNLQKIYSMLSHLITPSLVISDLSEVRRLLDVASSNEETFLVIDNDGMIVMQDYAKNTFSKFVSDAYKSYSDCKNLELIYRNINGKNYLINCSILSHDDGLNRKKKIGALLSFSSYTWFSFSPLILYFLGVLVGLLFILTILFRRVLHRKLLKPLVTFKDRILSISLSDSSTSLYIEEIDNAPRELVEIKEVFEKLLLNFKEEYGKRIDAEKMKALIDLAVGVAHDIRSPLIALDIIIKDIKSIPEEKRIVIRNSTNRINDIANNLLTHYSQRKPTDSVAASNQKPELISDLVMSLVSEKRAQHINDNVNLTVNVEENAYGRFSILSPSEFNRMLSNLIDNAIEAFAKEVEINLSLINPGGNSFLNIKIQDNGCGISPELLIKIISGEVVSSKTKGHGLGLPNSIKVIEKQWHGQFHIQSVINAGTVVDVVLPLVSPPKWFLSNLIVNPEMPIVILDDEESIHQVWKKRFNEVYGFFNFMDFYSPSEFLSWYRNTMSPDGIYLIDFEFIGYDKNGLNIIEELNITNKSFLVTSRHEDLNLRECCNEIGLKVIPKTFAEHLLITLAKENASNVIDLIFIDDNIAITQAWVLHGATRGKKVVSYNSIHSFRAELNKFDLTTPVYIDSDLNDVMKGENFAKELYDSGFKNIYLSTGYVHADFPKMFWIKEVVGKEPPF